MRPAAAPITPTKLPKFNGITELDPHPSEVQLVVWQSGWSDEEAATHLVLALQGKVLRVLLDLVSEYWRGDSGG